MAKIEAHIGHVEGVPLRSQFENRLALREARIHRPNQAGIDYCDRGACSIVVSGGYVDDEDRGDEIVYTGQGGNDPKTKRQIADQKWERGNAALARSQSARLPVRVARGYKGEAAYSPRSGYRYDGLFLVEDSWEERGRDGFLVCRFHLTEANHLVPEVDRQARPWSSERASAGPAKRLAPHTAPVTLTPEADHPGPAQDWVAELLFSPQMAARRSAAGAHVSAARLQALLSWLDANGGKLGYEALAVALGIPARRVSGFVATVGRMLNIDGYEIVSDDGTFVRLDADLARSQFGLG